MLSEYPKSVLHVCVNMHPVHQTQINQQQQQENGDRMSSMRAGLLHDASRDVFYFVSIDIRYIVMVQIRAGQYGLKIIGSQS